MKVLQVDNKDTYMTPFVVTLSSILRLHHGTSLVKFGFLQIETSCSHQDTVHFDVVKEKCDFTFSPSAACLLNVVCANAGWSLRLSVMGGR